MRQGRPGRRPDYAIELQGQTITPRARGRLSRLTLSDRGSDEADQLTLVLSDDDGQLEIPRRGVELSVAIGWSDTGLVDRGTFTVDEVQHAGAPDQLTIRARSANLREGLKERKSRSWHESSVGEILGHIAADHGLNPGVAERLGSLPVEHLDQTDESDINLIHRLAERHDALESVKAGRLLFVERGAGASASGGGLPAATLRRSDGDQHRYAEADRDRYTGVIAHWHDPDEARQYEALAGDDERPKRLRDEFQNEEEAQQAANGEWRRLQRGRAELQLTLAEGRPGLYAETPIRMRGWKTPIDEREWIASEVTHELADSGYTTQLRAQTPNRGDDD